MVALLRDDALWISEALRRHAQEVVEFGRDLAANAIMVGFQLKRDADRGAQSFSLSDARLTLIVEALRADADRLERAGQEHRARRRDRQGIEAFRQSARSRSLALELQEYLQERRDVA